MLNYAAQLAEARRTMTAELGYRWHAPADPECETPAPIWNEVAELNYETLIDSWTEIEWPVAEIRNEIRRLGGKPSGRSRRDLVEGLLFHYLDEHLLSAYSALSPNEQQNYLRHLLATRLEVIDVYVSPAFRSGAFQRLEDAGLILSLEGGFLPLSVMHRLPPAYLDFPTVQTAPTDYLPAADPQMLALHARQLMDVAAAVPAQQRELVSWKMRGPYGGVQEQHFPPLPGDARTLHNAPTRAHDIAMWPWLPRLDPPSLASWSQELGLPADRVEFLYNLLLASGILCSGSPVVVNEEARDNWLTLSPGRQIFLLFVYYRSLALWTDWMPDWRAGEIRLPWHYTNVWDMASLNLVMQRSMVFLRMTMLELLSYLPHDEWLSLEDVDNRMARLFPVSGTHRYLQSLRPLGKEEGRGESWMGFLRKVLRAMLRGPLHLFGMADLAPSGDAITHFRLHHLQDLHWDRVSQLRGGAVEDYGLERVVYNAGEGTLQVALPAPGGLLQAIQQWALAVGMEGQIMNYRLDPKRLHAAFEAQQTPTTLLENWQSHVDFPPPPGIVAWWERFYEHYGHVRLYPRQSVLLTRDAFTMQELQVALPRLGDAVLGLVTPRVALVTAEQVEQIRKDLERQGYMPKEIKQ